MTSRTRTLAKIVWAGAAAAAMSCWAGAGRADLLDDEDTANKPPKATPDNKVDEPNPAASAAPVTAPGDKKTSKAGKKPKKAADSGAPGSPEAAPVTTGGGGPTVVIPPKQPGAKPSVRKVGSNGEQPVHFDSQGLKGLRDKGLVELTKDVVVTHGDMRLEADHAQILFEEGQKEKKDKGLKKVVAEGSPVKIFGVDENSGDKFRGYGNQAIYLAKERTVILEGNARLWRGDDSVIRSKKITYEMDSGWIRADTVAGEVVPEKSASDGGSKGKGAVRGPPAESPPERPSPASGTPLPAPGPPVAGSRP